MEQGWVEQHPPQQDRPHERSQRPPSVAPNPERLSLQATSRVKYIAARTTAIFQTSSVAPATRTSLPADGVRGLGPGRSGRGCEDCSAVHYPGPNGPPQRCHPHLAHSDQRRDQHRKRRINHPRIVATAPCYGVAVRTKTRQHRRRATTDRRAGAPPGVAVGAKTSHHRRRATPGSRVGAPSTHADPSREPHHRSRLVTPSRRACASSTAPIPPRGRRVDNRREMRRGTATR